MKKLEKAEAVAAALTNLFQEDWKGFEFAQKAQLVRIKHDVPGQLAWMLSAKKGEVKIPFILECVSRLAYCCPPGFRYELAVPSDETFTDENGNVGKVMDLNGEIAIVWE